jgi:hypothetical protein
VRFETAPGEQAQVDWAHFGTIEHRGRMRPLYAFLFTLGWSRALYLEFTVAATTTAFLRCHQHAFQALGGCPQRLLYDNLKSVVLERDPDGAIRWNPTFLDFADHYGFTPAACRPYRAQTKGKVERSVGYVRAAFWPGLAITDLADLNRQAQAWVETVANRRVHGTTGAVPAERLPQEGLRPVAGRLAYDPAPVCYRRSSRDSFISYGGVLYSVPLAHAGQQLLVRELEEAAIVVITTQGEQIARHELAAGTTRRVVDPAHFVVPARPPSPRWAAGTSGPPNAVAASAGRAALVPHAPLVEVRPLTDYDRLTGVAP